MGDTALNWETFLPALALSYNTSYHSTIATTPFEMLFGEKARLPSFPSEDIQKVHYGETTAAERFNMLQRLRKIAHDNATTNGQKTKEQYYKKAMPHSFQISDKVLISNDFDTTKNPKLVPNWKGPGEIIDINDTNAKIKFKNKIKVLNVAKLKHFYKNIEKSVDKESDARQFNQNFNQPNEKALTDFSDIFNKVQSEGPITRAKAKLIRYKDAAQLALILLKSETDTIESLCDPSDNCGRCESEETYLSESKTLPFQWHQLKLAENHCKQWQLKLIKREAEKINSTEERCHSNVPERFCEPLMKVAYKLLSRDEATFEELTPSEQKLWNSFETDQIYRLLTGEPDTVPEFRFNWYTINTADGYFSDQLQPKPDIKAKAPVPKVPTRTPTPPPAPSATVKPPRASTSARATLPSLSTSSAQLSKPSTTLSSPTASTSSAIPKTKTSSSTDTAPGSSTDTVPSQSPLPPPQPTTATPKSAKGSGRRLRVHPDVNYRDLHLGQNLLLG